MSWTTMADGTEGRSKCRGYRKGQDAAGGTDTANRFVADRDVDASKVICTLDNAGSVLQRGSLTGRRSVPTTAGHDVDAGLGREFVRVG